MGGGVAVGVLRMGWATDVGDSVDLREALDIDSMSFLTFITALHARLDIDVPETDYAKLFTRAGAIEYLAKKLTGKGRRAKSG